MHSINNGSDSEAAMFALKIFLKFGNTANKVKKKKDGHFDGSQFSSLKNYSGTEVPVVPYFYELFSSFM